MTEELSELRSSTNQLRHESNNLRQEREVWKVRLLVSYPPQVSVLSL